MALLLHREVRLPGPNQIQGGASMPKGANKKIMPKIRGIILPEKWNDNGNVISVAIHTDDESTYLIEQNRKGRELLKLVRRKVEAICLEPAS